MVLSSTAISLRRWSNMKKRMRSFTVKAQGNSMYPLLRDGDTIEYVHTSFKNIRLNDTILIYTGDVLMTHRVIYKTRGECVTRGDNNNSADPQLQKGQVLARAVRFRRNGVWYGIQDVYLSQSMLYLQEIQKLETLFKLHNIKHVFIKGVLISLKYVGEIPKRIYGDCDVLVQRDDYFKIRTVFTLLGYRYSVIEHSFVSNKTPQSKPELNFIKKVRGIPIVFDVHLEPVFLMLQLGGMNLLYPKLQSLGSHLIEKGKDVNIKGFNYSLCSIPDQILYLALHIFHHNYTDIIRYQLLDAVIRKSATHKVWAELTHTIQSYQLNSYIYLVFILLKKYCKTPIPRSFISLIRPSPFKKAITDIFSRRVDVFSGDSRLKAGVERFILIFFLSPEPFGKKLLLFVHPDVLALTIKVAWSFVVSRVSQARRRLIQ